MHEQILTRNSWDTRELFEEVVETRKKVVEGEYLLPQSVDVYTMELTFEYLFLSWGGGKGRGYKYFPSVAFLSLSPPPLFFRKEFLWRENGRRFAAIQNLFKRPRFLSQVYSLVCYFKIVGTRLTSLWLFGRTCCKLSPPPPVQFPQVGLQGETEWFTHTGRGTVSAANIYIYMYMYIPVYRFHADARLRCWNKPGYKVIRYYRPRGWYGLRLRVHGPPLVNFVRSIIIFLLNFTIGLSINRPLFLNTAFHLPPCIRSIVNNTFLVLSSRLTPPPRRWR